MEKIIYGVFHLNIVLAATFSFHCSIQAEQHRALMLFTREEWKCGHFSKEKILQHIISRSELDSRVDLRYIFQQDRFATEVAWT